MARRMAQIRALFGEDAVNAVKNAIAESANEIVADAKTRCPKKTGKLRDSIKAEKQNGGATFKISSLYYGRFVELSPRINRPFLYPALDANRNRIREKIKTALRRVLRRH